MAPPTPARSKWQEFHALSVLLGIEPFPWQDSAARYLTALGPDDRWLYREVAIIVSRQSGKTTLLKPLVIGRLLSGQRITHTAQNRQLPRDLHEEIAELLLAHFPKMLPKRHGIKWGVGLEGITLTTGGTYRIVAPTRGGARGPANDLVIIDELREMDDHDFIAAAKPSLAASPNPQIVYLSNAGTEQSVVLSALQKRAATDAALAYLEWSAAPERRPDELAGWLEANPDIGHNPGKLEYLRGEYESNRQAGTLGIFETEHLCRGAVTTRRAFLSLDSWTRAEMPLGDPVRPVLGVSMAPDGSRASAVAAWQLEDKLAVRVVADVTGSPIDVDRLGPDLAKLARELRAVAVAHDPWTMPLARYFRNPHQMTGREYVNASGDFIRRVEDGTLRWDGTQAIAADLAWTGTKAVQDGGRMATMVDEAHPVTALLAAIRAAWLASDRSTTSGHPRIW